MTITASVSASYTASSTATASGSGNTLEEAINNANISALNEAKKLLLDLDTNTNTNTNDTNSIIYIDNLVIGSGIGGTYLSARLKNIKPNESILIIDKLNDYGGLQLSSKIPDTNEVIELGGLRFFPKYHTRVNYLANKYNLPLTLYLNETNGRVYNLRGKQFTDDNLIIGSQSVYNIREDEKGINPFITLNNNLEKYFTSLSDLTTDLSYRIELSKNLEYCQFIFQIVAQQDMSNENWNRVNDIMGYANLFSSNINLVGGAKNFFLFGILDYIDLSITPLQYRFSNGFNSLTKSIAINNNIKNISFDELQNNKDLNNINTLFNTAILNIEYSNIKQLWKVEIGKVNITSPEDINYESSYKQTIYVKNIYCTIPVTYLNTIYNFSNKLVNLYNNSFYTINPLRIYLKFDSDWMTENNIGCGKSITNNGEQLIHYSNNILMIYAYNEKCSKLYNFIPNNKQEQKTMIYPNDSTKLLIDECIKIIKQTYNIQNISNINGISYMSWVESIRLHTSRNKQTLSNQTVYDELMDIMFPFGKEGNFYVIENTSSFNSAWSEGSLEIVDFFMNLKYGEPLFGEVLIN